MEFWVILLALAALALAVYLLIINFMEGLAVFCDGWEFKNYLYCYNPLLWILTLPGAILGFILAIITFQWTHWY